jgi:anaerobic magnesium-protoporphyrin IX monomethyl ester cyclase
VTLSSSSRCVALVRGPIVTAAGAVNNEATPAIALAYIAATIRQGGYEPVLVDAIADGLNRIWNLDKYPGFGCQGLTFAEIIEQIPADVRVIGVSGMFSSEWPVMRDLITEIRAQFPHALLVAGGEHVTALTEYSLRDCPALDVCVRGEGERTFLALLDAWYESGTYEGVPSLGYLDAAGAYRESSGVARIRDVDSLPWPEWPEGYLEKFWAAGKSFGIGTARDMPFMLSRGCPYRCTFCSNERMWTTRYILREIDDVIAELKHYIERYDITSVQLYDLTAIVNRNWLLEFAARIQAEGIAIQWSTPSGTRSEALDQQGLAALRQIGCQYLVYAPESGSAETLKRIQKRIDLDKLTASVLEAKRQGYTIRINLILAFPEDTWMDLIKTILYGLKMAARGVDEVPFYIFSPYPGTAIFEALRDDQRLALNDSFFFRLSALNSAYLSADVLSFNPRMNPRVLGMIRLGGLLTTYAVGYLLYPKRIVRTLKAVFGSEHRSFTVFEHRLKDMMARRRAVVGDDRPSS